VLDAFSRWPADDFPGTGLALMADSVDPKVQKAARPDAAHPRVGRNSRRSLNAC